MLIIIEGIVFIWAFLHPTFWNFHLGGYLPAFCPTFWVHLLLHLLTLWSLGAEADGMEVVVGYLVGDLTAWRGREAIPSDCAYT